MALAGGWRPLSPPNEPHIMNIKSFLRFKAAVQVAAQHNAMAERVATLAGCLALEQELTQQLLAYPGFSSPARDLRRKLDELQRIQKALAMDADRARVAGVIQSDREEATKGLKAAEARIKTLRIAAATAAEHCASRTATIEQLNQQLAALSLQADQAVAVAEAAVREVITSGKHDAEAEAQAFAKLKEAQLQRATGSGDLPARLREHEAELRRLEDAANAAAMQVEAAQDDWNLWSLKLARVDYDQAAQLAVDAYLNMRKLPHADRAGQNFALPNVPPVALTFASRDRAVLGGKVCGEHAGLREFALADLAKALQPANLALLVAPIAIEPLATAEVAPPDPHIYIPGSTDFENAKEEQKRFAMGAERYEASARAEQRA